MKKGIGPASRVLLPGRAAASLLLLGAGLAIGGYRRRARDAERHSRVLERKFALRAGDLQVQRAQLNCLFGIGELTARQGISLEEILRGTLALLPTAWPHPELVCGRIVLNDQEYTTANYLETPWQQSAAILVHGLSAGRVMVGYMVPRPDGDGGPFPGSEQRLLDAVAQRLGMIVQRLQSEQLLSALARAVEESTSTVVITDVPGKILYVNRGFTDVTGYTAQQVLGQNPRLLNSGEQSAEFYRDLWVEITAGNEWRGEFINKKKNGELYWELASILPVTNPEGELTHFVKVGENVTERKRVDDALKIAHRFLNIANRHSDMESLLREFAVQTQAITGCAAVAIRLVEAGGTVTHQAYVGFDPSHSQPPCALGLAEGRCMADFPADGEAGVPVFRSAGGSYCVNGISRLVAIPEPDRGPACAACRAAGYESVAVIPIRQNDRTLGCIVMADPREDGIRADMVETLEEAGSLLGAAVERVLAQEAIRDREMTARALLNAPADAAVLLEPDGTIVALNEAEARLFGRSVDTLVGQNVLGLYTAGLVDARRAALDTVLSSGLPVHLGERRVGARTYDSQMYPVRDLDGRVVRAAIYARDITERKQSEIALRKARDELATLLALSGELVSTLELEPLLDLILAKLASVVDYDYACILTLTGDALEVQASRGYGPATDFTRLQLARDDVTVVADMLRTKWPFYIADFRRGASQQTTANPKTGLPSVLIPAGNRSWLGAPLLIKNQMIGMLCLGHRLPKHYDQEALRIVQAFANEAAIAIANARLYRQAHEAAAVEERSRLARELHDSVTQTLFSANLIANSLPDALARDPAEALRDMEKLRRLTQGALAQMRSMLLEVRPSGLVEEPLGALLGHLAQAFGAQTGIAVDLRVEGDCTLPADPQIALYRIAQEATNNIAKHAQAGRVTIEFGCSLGRAHLRIGDDGRGFDPAAVLGDHLGLGIMRERAHEVGADITIESRPGQGTQILVTWPGSLREAQHHD